MARYAYQFEEAGTTTSSSITQKQLFDGRKTSYKQSQYKDTAQQNQGGNGVKCYECGIHGHKCFNCNYRKFPNNRLVTATEKQETPPKNTYLSDHQRGSYNTSLDGNYGYHGHGRGRQGSACVEKHGNLPCVGDSLALYETDMPVVKGCVGDEVVTVLRDTGCSGAVIRIELVTEKQLQGTFQRYKLADGRVIDADVGRINVDMPYFTGSVGVWFFDSP